MGKAARLKQQRRAPKPPPPVGKNRPASAQRMVWLASGGVIVVIVVVVIVLLTQQSSPKVAGPSTPSASDRNASASLVSAANAIDFHPTTEPGVGEIESKPASAARPSTSTALLLDGSTAPDFTLKTPQGQSVSLSDYRGKAVLLEFFATWCPHCNAEAPHLAKLARSLADRNVKVISVNADGENGPSVFAFHRYYGLPYPALVDPGSQTGSFTQQGSPGSVTTAYRVASYPTFYVIDRHGNIDAAGVHLRLALRLPRLCQRQNERGQGQPAQRG